MSKKPTPPQRRSRKDSTPAILRFPSEIEYFLDPLNPNLAFGIKPDILMSFPEDSDFRAQLFLVSVIANALTKFPPDSQEAREQMLELAADLKGTTFGWGLGGVIIVCGKDYLGRLYPHCDLMNLHEFLARWFDQFLSLSSPQVVEQAVRSLPVESLRQALRRRTGDPRELVLATVLVESLKAKYREAAAR